MKNYLPFLLLVAFNTSAQTTPRVGEETPQATCERTAKEWYQKTQPKNPAESPNARKVNTSYKTFVSPTSARCTVRVETRVTAASNSPSMLFAKVFEGVPSLQSSRGEVTRFGEKIEVCKFEGKPCKSLEEWEQLAAAFSKK